MRLPSECFFAVCCLLWVSAGAMAEVCPPWDVADSPCNCHDELDSAVVRCTGPAQSSEVVSALNAMRSSGGPWDLHLELLDLQDLPPVVRTASSLRLVRCRVGRLPADWPRLAELVLESVALERSQDPWSQLKGLKSLKASSFPLPLRSLPPGLESLELRRTGATHLEPACMSHLRRLRYAFFADMPLREFPRSSLPRTLPHLHTFILGNTLVSSLSADFFEGMPQLKVLMLNGNRFTSLDPRLFAPLRNHLTHLVAERNPLLCACDLLWLRREFREPPTHVMATCYDPTSDAFEEVMQLREEDYCEPPRDDLPSSARPRRT